jgi:hypothetical protein
MNYFDGGVCLHTPMGYHIHFYVNGAFAICPEDRDGYNSTYNPGAVARWLVAEGWDQLFQPDYQQLEIPL